MSGEIIKTYQPGTWQHNRLVLLKLFLAQFVPEADARIEDVWFDLGAGLMWTTVTVSSDPGGQDQTSRYQLLSMPDQSELLSDDPHRMASTMAALASKAAEVLGRKGAAAK